MQLPEPIVASKDASSIKSTVQDSEIVKMPKTESQLLANVSNFA